MHYLLFYEVGEDYLSQRAEFREEHLAKACKASAQGELVLGGALADPVDRAVLLFKGDTPEVAEKFARVDPYVMNGLVKRWYVREWTTVAGEDAATPIELEAEDTRKKPAERVSGEEGKSMILRLWKARSTVEKASEYIQYATTKVFPALSAMEGHRGAYLLRRTLDGASEFVVLTLWQSMAAVRRFARDNPEKAVVDPPARAMLASLDDSVAHFEVVHSPESQPRK